ncbi:MAG: xanthine dehydrogenase family protein molybdopterin-binding subunit [Hyphomicrobiales bacterium]
MTGPKFSFDKPGKYVGQPTERPDTRRLLKGRGKFVDDIQLPRMLHAAFLRSPVAHAKIKSIDTSAAEKVKGVVKIFKGTDFIGVVEPYVGVLSHLAGLRSAPQMPLATDTVRWQGEPVVMIIANSRAIAEDAASEIILDLEDLPAVTNMETALNKDEHVIHSEFDSNLAWERTVDVGNVDEVYARDDVVTVEKQFLFGRHTGVTLEARATIANYDPSENQLDVYYSGQAPHMMQFIYAKHLDMPEENVRVTSHDVGGAFGIKVHTYGDEIATAAAAKLMERPIKFLADRYESFMSDIHARDHVINGKMTVSKDGKILALEYDDITGIGPFSMYPRTSAIEANQVLNLTGGPYTIPNYRANAKVVFQNKNMMCQYRAVGHPIAMALCDGLLEEAAAAIDMDSVELRKRNLIPDDTYPTTSTTGMKLDDLSHQKALSKLIEMMDYEKLKKENTELKKQGVYRGIGFCSMIEVTNPSPMFYGIGGAPIASQDGATIRLDAGGGIHVASSVTEQGQGTNAVLAQVAADVFGVDMDRVQVTTGDTKTTPYGGGTWASRGAGIGGEAVYLAAEALKDQVLDVAGVMLQSKPEDLNIDNGHVVDHVSKEKRMSLSDLARTVYYRGNELPSDMSPELIATRHFRVTDTPFVFTNGAMAAHVELDIETGIVKILNFWAVEDCGRVINPMLVDEQIRGGVVQGIGHALYEECLYSDDGQLLNTTLADYLVPMAAEMPEIHVGHIETPTKTSVLGAKGAGEAGTGGAPACIINAVNDILRPLGVTNYQIPMTPNRLLDTLKSAKI